MRLVLACTYACQDETTGDTLEQAKLSQLTPEKMASAMVGMAFNKLLYRFTFGLLFSIMTKFMRASARVGIAGQSEACRKHDTLERLPSIAALTLVKESKLILKIIANGKGADDGGNRTV